MALAGQDREHDKILILYHFEFLYLVIVFYYFDFLCLFFIFYDFDFLCLFFILYAFDFFCPKFFLNLYFVGFIHAIVELDPESELGLISLFLFRGSLSLASVERIHDIDL